MSQILVGTTSSPFSHERLPITPDTMGAFAPLTKDHFIELFKQMENSDLANFALVNWTCKEVVERNTEWGERKRFFRILPSLFKHISVQDTLEYNGVRVDTEVTQHLYTLHPGEDVAITRNLQINNVLMMTFSTGSFGSFTSNMTFFYTVAGEDSPPRRQEKYYYQLSEHKLKNDFQYSSHSSERVKLKPADAIIRSRRIRRKSAISLAQPI